MKIPRYVWHLVGIGGAVGLGYYLWSKREVHATVTVPEDEIKISVATTKDDAAAFDALLRSQGLEP